MTRTKTNNRWLFLSAVLLLVYFRVIFWLSERPDNPAIAGLLHELTIIPAILFLGFLLVRSVMGLIKEKKVVSYSFFALVISLITVILLILGSRQD